MAVTTALYFTELALASLDQASLGGSAAACQLQHAIDLLESRASRDEFDAMVRTAELAG